MDGQQNRSTRRKSIWQHRLLPLSVGGILLVTGCSTVSPVGVPYSGNSNQVSVVQPVHAGGQTQVVRGQLPEYVETETKTLPISLDTIFRLAQNQNAEIGLAREKLNEAFAFKEVADKAWLPDIYIGASYYRHEGGIQDQDGRFIHSSFGSLFGGLELNGKLDLRDAAYQRIEAERRIWQQRGELKRLTSENLLDAAQTYVDLLAAKSGQAIARESEQLMQQLLEEAQKRASVEPGSQVEVNRVQSQMAAQRQIERKVREGAASASAKLSHLLGLDIHASLVVMERSLAPFQLIDPGADLNALIAQALAQGPGVQEMEGLLALIYQSQERAGGIGEYLPVLELRMAEGGFGAAPGASLTWDNRWDMALQARWNITDSFTAHARKRMVHSKIEQAQLGHRQLQSKLTLGVREAWESLISNAEQMRLAQDEIKQAREAYRLSKLRYDERLPQSSASEVLLAIRAIAAAQISYLDAVRGFDKAQIRLWILTGKSDAGHHTAEIH